MERFGHFRSCLGLLSLSAFLLTACGGGGGGGGRPPPGPGAVQLSVGAVTVDEHAASVQLTINRVDGSDGAISVKVASSDGSASAGQDYTALVTTVDFAAGDRAPKSVAITVADDAAAELDETLSITLSEPTGGARLGGPATATVTIRDDDPPLSPVLGV